MLIFLQAIKKKKILYNKTKMKMKMMRNRKYRKITMQSVTIIIKYKMCKYKKNNSKYKYNSRRKKRTSIWCLLWVLEKALFRIISRILVKSSNISPVSNSAKIVLLEIKLLESKEWNCMKCACEWRFLFYIILFK